MSVERPQEGNHSPENFAEQAYRPTADDRGSVDRLVVDNGRGRYVSNPVWVSIGDDIAEMRDLLDEPSSDEENGASQGGSGLGQGYAKSAASQSFVFGHPLPSSLEFRSLHPPKGQLSFLWDIYKERVEPLVKVLHRPSAEKLLVETWSKSRGTTRSADAVLFAICLAATASLDPQECQMSLGESQDAMTNRFRMATELALAQAGFLTSSNLMVLQAFVIYLICLRNQDDTHLVAVLSNLAVHIAVALGVHKDGTNFGLSPFETEMRRRLWWNVQVVETRSSMDQGSGSIFCANFSDTKLPSNVDDDDIYPELEKELQPRAGSTEMTLSLVRFELVSAIRRLHDLEYRRQVESSSLRDTKTHIIEECRRSIENQYLAHCDTTIP